MEQKVCELCHSKKTSLRCDSCGDVSCKKCVQFVDEDFFEMLSLLPDELQNKTFCFNCFNQGIDEKITHYRGMVEKAKSVDIYSKNQTKETRRIKRKEAPIKVENCDDQQEAVMKLAFIAADKGFNTIVDMDIFSKKVGDGKSYKKLVWNGQAIPVDPTIRKA